MRSGLSANAEGRLSALEAHSVSSGAQTPQGNLEGGSEPELSADREMDQGLRPSAQKATALAAATFSESTPWDMGMQTV